MDRLQIAAIIIASAVLCSPAASIAGEFRRLNGAEIRKLVTGKVVTDDVHYRDLFLPGGKYEGVSMGRSFTGTWTVRGNELCFTRVEGEKPDCSEIWQSRKDPKQIELRRSWETEGHSALVLAR